VIAGVRGSEALEVEEGAPLMLVERIAYSRAGQPLEYAATCCRRPDPGRHRTSELAGHL